MANEKISLSATGIKDYIDCPLRWWYRRHVSGEALPSPELQVGSAVHGAIEKHWDSQPRALKYAVAEVEHLGPTNTVKTTRLVGKFFESFSSYLHAGDKTELNFALPMKGFKNVTIRGRIDRITVNGQIFDWKTTVKPPYTIDNDIQFMLYYWAYRELYKKPPTAVYFASLSTGKLIPYNHNEQVLKVLFRDVLPDMVFSIQEERFPPLGLVNDKCYFCSYREPCHKDLEVRKEDSNELVRSIFSD